MNASNTLLFEANTLMDMEKKSINDVFAENLAALMLRKDVNQPTLSAMSKVSQKTVSNYLNPGQRVVGSNGKQPSAKLTELEMIATALGVDPWQLLRPLNSDQRAAYEAIEAAFKALQPKTTPPAPVLVSTKKKPKSANGA